MDLAFLFIDSDLKIPIFTASTIDNTNLIFLKSWFLRLGKSWRFK